VKGLGLGNGTEPIDLVLRKSGVNKGIALGIGINHCNCFDKLWANSKFYRDNGTTLMKRIFTRYRRSNKDNILWGFPSAT
jgi:hypothetical protein